MAVALHWFRKGLRLHDNPALLEACRDAKKVYPVFIIDPWFAQPEVVGPNRFRFLLECLEDLDEALRRIDSRLFVVRGKPDEVLPRLFSSWGITRMTFESDTEPYSKERDASACRLAREAGVEVSTFATHTLFDPERVLAAARHTVPASYGKFTKLMEGLGSPEHPAAAPLKGELPPVDADVPDSEHAVPTLAELGYPEPALPSKFPGGEKEALRRLDVHMAREQWVCAFEKPKTEPTALDPATTVLSPYLKFGALSPRTFYWRLQDIFSRHSNHSKPPVSLLGQLYWREFFYLNGHAVPNFDRMEGNPICKQIPWREDGAEETERLFKAWEEGRTGYPFIDAIMTQLREEGWMHHLARHAVACFLTRGDLWVSWERGARVFDRHLLDADWSINNGNWMWLSASAFFHQFFRVYSPVAFGKKTDKQGAFIRRYLPMLAKMPAKYIYEPWKAPLAVQREAGCVIGEDYPAPIVDHAVVSKENIGKMKEAYAAARSGKKVADASRKRARADT